MVVINEKVDLNFSTEEAISSMEIDSSAAEVTNHKSLIVSADSYVSTSEPTESASRAQVLEELRARIRELEASPLKLRSNHDEEHYKCYLCKVSRIISLRASISLMFAITKDTLVVLSIFRIRKNRVRNAKLLHHLTSFERFMFKTRKRKLFP